MPVEFRKLIRQEPTHALNDYEQRLRKAGRAPLYGWQVNPARTAREARARARHQARTGGQAVTDSIASGPRRRK